MASVDTARTMGKRAGEAARGSGLPEKCPFDAEALPELFKAWSSAYVAAAYGKSAK